VAKIKRRFSNQVATAQKGLRLTMNRMGVSDYEVTEKDGRIAIIMFVLNGREYRYICDKYIHPADNYRAAQVALDYMWRIHEDYCVRAEGGDFNMETLMKGFRVLKNQEVLLALPAEKKHPWEILGVDRNATIEEVHKAYRKMAKENHPDKGGDTEAMQRLTAAKDEMLELAQ